VYVLVLAIKRKALYKLKKNKMERIYFEFNVDCLDEYYQKTGSYAI
jgi:hypothetical protein